MVTGRELDLPSDFIPLVDDILNLQWRKPLNETERK